MAAVDLHVAVRAKTPGRIDGQRMAVSLNGRSQPARDLPSEFALVEFEVPRSDGFAGENLLCLEFERGAPKAHEPQPIAAHVQDILVTPKTPSWPSPLWGLERQRSAAGAGPASP
jgi:hypothetical protein